MEGRTEDSQGRYKWVEDPLQKLKNLDDNGMADSNLSMWRKTEKGTMTLVADACLKETALI